MCAVCKWANAPVQASVNMFSVLQWFAPNLRAWLILLNSDIPHLTWKVPEHNGGCRAEQEHLHTSHLLYSSGSITLIFAGERVQVWMNLCTHSVWHFFLTTSQTILHSLLHLLLSARASQDFSKTQDFSTILLKLMEEGSDLQSWRKDTCTSGACKSLFPAANHFLISTLAFPSLWKASNQVTDGNSYVTDPNVIIDDRPDVQGGILLLLIQNSSRASPL